MTTRKDVEEALDKIDNLQRMILDIIAISEVNGVKAIAEWSVKNEFKLYKQALKEKLSRFDTIGAVEYVQEQEQTEKSDEE